MPGDHPIRRKTDTSMTTRAPAPSVTNKGHWFPEGSQRPSVIPPGAPPDQVVTPPEPPSTFHQRIRRTAEGKIVYPVPTTPVVPSPVMTSGPSHGPFTSNGTHRDTHSSSHGVAYGFTGEEASFSGHAPAENLDDFSLLTPPASRQSGRRDVLASAQRDMADILEVPVRVAPLFSASTWEVAGKGEMSSMNAGAGTSNSRELHTESKDTRHDREHAQAVNRIRQTRASSQGAIVMTRSTDDVPGGLGLAFSSSSIGTQAVSEPLDIESLNRSLQQLSNREEPQPEHARHTASQPTGPSDPHVGLRSGLPLYRSRSFGPSSSTPDILPDSGLSLPSLKNENAATRNHNDEFERASHSQASRETRPGEEGQGTSRMRRASESQPFLAPAASSDPGYDRPNPSSHSRHTFEVRHSAAVPQANTQTRSRRSTREPVLPSFSSVINSNITVPAAASSGSQSMLLSFHPSVPTSTSAAVPHRGSGDPSRIHAPYPIHGRQTGLMQWPASRSSR